MATLHDAQVERTGVFQELRKIEEFWDKAIRAERNEQCVHAYQGLAP